MGQGESEEGRQWNHLGVKKGVSGTRWERGKKIV